MDYISLADIKNHLNIDNNLDDAYLTDLLATAQDSIERNIGRKFTDSECLDSNGHLAPSLKHAMRLLVGTWYASREAIVFTTSNLLPFSVSSLIQPFIKY